MAYVITRLCRDCIDTACVAVCPVDPYVENSYYESIRKLEPLVQNGKANLTPFYLLSLYLDSALGRHILVVGSRTDSTIPRGASGGQRSSQVPARLRAPRGG